MIMRMVTLAIVCVAFLLACKPTTSAVPVSAADFAQSLLGQECQLSPNSTGTLLMAIGRSVEPRSRVIVLRIADNKILLDEKFIPGFARWQTDSAIALLDMPEVMPSTKNPDDFIQIINVNNPLP